MEFNPARLPKTDDERVQAIALARSLVDSPEGRALARDLADSPEGLDLARSLADSPEARALARSLAARPAGRALARDLAATPAGRRLGRDLAHSPEGRNLALYLADTPEGRDLALSLATSAVGRDLVRSLATSPEGLDLARSLVDSPEARALARDLAATPAGRDLALSLATSPGSPSMTAAVIIARLSSIMVMAGLTAGFAAAGVLFVAGVATSLTPVSGLDVGLVNESGKRYQVRVDLGPNANLGEIGQILLDLQTLVSVAAVWGTEERRLAAEAEGDPRPDSTTTLTVAPTTGLGDDEPVLYSLQYHNPLDVIIGGGVATVGALAALLKIAQTWHTDIATRAANQPKIEAEAAKLEAEAEATKARAEAAKLEAEADKLRLENDLYIQLLREAEDGSFRASPETVFDLVKNHPDNPAEALARLSQYKIEVTELPEPAAATIPSSPGEPD